MTVSSSPESLNGTRIGPRSTAITLDRLEAFCAVVETGSFRGAAQRLFLSQPAVSMHIKVLEQYCHTPLLIRSQRGIVPTDAGKKLYEQAQGLLQQLYEIERTAKGLRRFKNSTLRLGISRGMASVRTFELLSRLQHSHPQLEVEVRWGATANLTQQLLDGKLDAALVVNEFVPSNVPRIASVLSGSDRVVPAASPAFIRAWEMQKRPSLLATGPYIKHGGSCALQPYVEAQLPVIGNARVALVCDDANEARESVLYGLGVSFFLESTIERELAEGRLCLVDEPVQVPMVVHRVLLVGTGCQAAVTETLIHEIVGQYSRELVPPSVNL